MILPAEVVLHVDVVSKKRIKATSFLTHGILVSETWLNSLSPSRVRGRTWIAVILRGITEKELQEQHPELHEGFINSLMTTGGKFIELAG